MKTPRLVASVAVAAVLTWTSPTYAQVLGGNVNGALGGTLSGGMRGVDVMTRGSMDGSIGANTRAIETLRDKANRDKAAGVAEGVKRRVGDAAVTTRGQVESKVEHAQDTSASVATAATASGTANTAVGTAVDVAGSAAGSIDSTVGAVGSAAGSVDSSVDAAGSAEWTGSSLDSAVDAAGSASSGANVVNEVGDGADEKPKSDSKRNRGGLAGGSLDGALSSGGNLDDTGFSATGEGSGRAEGAVRRGERTARKADGESGQSGDANDNASRKRRDKGILAKGAADSATQSDVSTDGSSTRASAQHDSNANGRVKTKRTDVKADAQSSSSVEANASTQR